MSQCLQSRISRSKLTPTVKRGNLYLILLCEQAMSQRFQFIPAIATSISSILQNTKNPVLQRKESIIASSTDPGQPDPPHASQKKATIRTALKQALWRSAQKQLYKPETSRHLSPLSFASDLDESHSALKETALFAPSTTGETEIIDADDEDTYDSDYYLGTEIDEFESEAQDEAEETISLISLTEDYTNLSIDMFTTIKKEDNTHPEPTKASDEMYIDSDMELNIDIEDPDHTDEFYVLPPASHQSIKFPASDSEMLTSDCPEDDTDLTDPISQSTTGTLVTPGQEEIIIDEDFDDDMLCEHI